MDESMLLNGVLRSVLGGRGRRRSRRAMNFLTGGSGSSFWTNPTTLLTAAGVAWGIFETMQNSGTFGTAAVAAPATAASSTTAAPPLPNVGAQSATMSPDALRIVRLAISAA